MYRENNDIMMLCAQAERRTESECEAGLGTGMQCYINIATYCIYTVISRAQVETWTESWCKTFEAGHCMGILYIITL